VARDVKDPVSGKSLLEARRGRQGGEASLRLGPLGAGSDYVAFIDHLGVSSLNLGFSGEGGGGVYHSIYDSFYWYTKFSDGDFVYGRALTQVMALSLMRLADASVLPFEFATLEQTVRGYAEELRKQAETASGELDLGGVFSELGRLEANAHNYEEALAAAARQIDSAPKQRLGRLNETLYRTERALLSAQGLPNREWYRHQLYAPGLYTGYGAKTLPGIREAVEAGRWEEANEQARIVAKVLGAFNDRVEDAARQLRSLSR
jgi:N-acetylated-alpha-linked acidic dipeptidase